MLMCTVTFGKSGYFKVVKRGYETRGEAFAIADEYRGPRNEEVILTMPREVWASVKDGNIWSNWATEGCFLFRFNSPAPQGADITKRGGASNELVKTLKY